MADYEGNVWKLQFLLTGFMQFNPAGRFGHTWAVKILLDNFRCFVLLQGGPSEVGPPTEADYISRKRTVLSDTEPALFKP